ncbi:MAG: hypothetical protein QXZ70_00185 [Candidatus Bathyarchaeia archaeon]
MHAINSAAPQKKYLSIFNSFSDGKNMLYRKNEKMYFQKEVIIGKMEKGYIIILRTQKNPLSPEEDVYITLDETLKRAKDFLEK